MHVTQDAQKTWKDLYQDALFELDPVTFAAKLDAAQEAIEERIHEVVSGGQGYGKELTELQQAKGVVLSLAITSEQI